MSRRRPKGNYVETRMARSLDKLAKIEAFDTEVLPILQKAVLEGWTPEQMRKHPKIRAYMTARQITIGLTELDSSKAMAAIKDYEDRTGGKPKETVETTHKYEKLKEEELDSLIFSELAELADKKPLSN